jgi:hypothetical protein
MVFCQINEMPEARRQLGRYRLFLGDQPFNPSKTFTVFTPTSATA